MKKQSQQNQKERKKSLLFKLIIILCLVSILGTIVLGLFTWRWADDYNLFNKMSMEGSVFSFLKYFYQNWDGRFCNLAALFFAIFIKHLPVEAAIIFWSIFFVLSAYLISKIFDLENQNKKPDLSTQILQTGLILVVLWHGMKAHIAQTVYWMSGGVYIFHNFMGLLWCFSLMKWMSGKNKFRSRLRKSLVLIIFFLTSLVVGMETHNLTTALLALGAILIIIRLLENKRFDYKTGVAVAALIGLLIGGIIISSAPGNFIRAQASNNSFDFSLTSITKNFIFAFKWYWRITKPMLLYSVFAGFLFAFLFHMNRCVLKKEYTRLAFKKFILRLPKPNLVLFLKNIKWLITALATILPFIAVSYFLSDRTAIFFQNFVLIFLFTVTFKVFKKYFYTNKPKKPNYLQKNWGYFLIFLILSAHSIFLADQIHHSIKIKQQINRRLDYLKNVKQKNRIIEVRPIYGKIPFSRQFHDITPDENDWKNGGLSQYFKIKGVKLKSK